MKKQIITVFLSIIVFTAFSQSENYHPEMTGNLKSMSQVRNVYDMQKVANKFERIAMAEKDQWLPWYYAAYCNIIMCYMGISTENIDPQLDKAQKMIDNSRAIDKENDEIEVLQGFLHQARIQVDPEARGFQYSVKSNKSFLKAKKINPDNPRVYYLIGQNILHTPEAFGGGTAAACPKLKIASDKFEQFKPENDLAPNWGEEMNNDLLEMCK